jgi:two-component system, NarL family, sensor histidine kinase UhpB
VTLRTHLETLGERSGTPIVMEFPTELQRLPAPAEVALYRIVQECLTSVLHLPGNSQAKVRLAVHEGHLRLQVGDQGRGISPRTLEEVRHGIGELGVAIAGMRERMARLGGTLEITSTHTETWVTATLPVDLPP